MAIRRQHGFCIQAFGETGSLRRASEQPNRVIYAPVGGPIQIIGKGEGGLQADETRLWRVVITRGEARGGLPSVRDGVRSMTAVHAAVASTSDYAAWLDARPPLFGKKPVSGARATCPVR